MHTHNQLAVTAYHEAGHAAALFALGKGCRGVMIRDDGNGRATRRWGDRWLGPDDTVEAFVRAIVAYAGPLAEYEYRQRERLPMNWNPSGNDNDNVRRLALITQWPDLPHEAFEAAKRLVTTPAIWAGICTLANTLQSSRSMSGRLVHRIFRDPGVYAKRIRAIDGIFPLSVIPMGDNHYAA